MKKLLVLLLGAGWITTVSFSATVTWTQGGFDVTIDGAQSVKPWDPYTKAHYAVVTSGGSVTITVKRNANMRDVNGTLRSAGTTRAHIGAMAITRNAQMWAPSGPDYVAQGGFNYTQPFQVTSVTQPVPVQIWNNHGPITFGSGSWELYGSNGIQVWILPNTVTPANVRPGFYSNGRLPAGQLVTAPAGRWPAVYRDAADKQRLHDAVAALFTNTATVHGADGTGRGGDYYVHLAHDCAKNALIGWHTGSAGHLARAKQQILALYSEDMFGRVAPWGPYTRRTLPSGDLCTSYGREETAMFGNGFLAACILGPNMTNTLNTQELAVMNAHMYSYAVHDIYSALSGPQYYSADGGINMHWDLICFVAGSNWNLPDLLNIHKVLGTMHNECTYYIDNAGVGTYSLRYCQVGNPSDKNYEDTGNSQAARWFVRYSEIFKKWDFFDTVGFIDAGKKIGLPALKEYVLDHYQGGTGFAYGNQALSCWMYKWQYQAGQTSSVSFDVSSRQGQPPLEVSFTNTTQGDYTTWAWDFGDGGSSTEKNPKHTYTGFGTYTVKLTGSGGTAGSETYTWTDCIMIKLDAITIEAEDMTLAGYVIDPRMNNQGIMLDANAGAARGTGTAAFTGASGTYNLTMVVSPENDGEPTLKVYADTRLLSTRVYPMDPGYHDPATTRFEYTVQDVTVNQGEVIKIEGFKEGAAFARVDKLIFDPVTIGVNDGRYLMTGNDRHAVRVSPNPMRNLVVFAVGDIPSGTIFESSRLSIYNHSGTAVYQAVSRTAESSLYWEGKDTSGQPVKPGIYYYSIRSGQQTFAGRIMKTR